MGHFVVGDDATGIGIGKATLDHHAERQLPDQLFTRAVVGLLLQQADEVLSGRGHERTLAPAAAKLQSNRDPAHRAIVAYAQANAAASTVVADMSGVTCDTCRTLGPDACAKELNAPIELAGDVDDDGTPLGVTVTRS